MKIHLSHRYRLLLAALALLLAASLGLSAALRHGWGRRFLLARLAASFGRPVDAGSFDFSLLGGPSLEADGVSVSEDPQFGQEYFLRADQLKATLNWSALLRGSVEFGTLAFESPSLNLVRAAAGRWNVESWLPPANLSAARADLPANSTAEPVAAPKRLRHIVIDDGRINFKLGDEKILLALTGVSGNVDQDGSGRWNLDLEADPLRASVALQKAGTLRLRGSVAGTSTRLRPASLLLTWEDASLADVLRLARGQDYGVRGALGAEISARLDDSAVDDSAAPGPWRIAGRFHLNGIHRWDLTAHPADPGLNLSFSAAWQPALEQISVSNCLLETAHSQLHAAGAADWSHGFKPQVRVTSSHIRFDDLLAWTRAFHTSLPDGFGADGALELQTELQGWPLHATSAGISGEGASVHLPGLNGPIRVGAISASLRKDSLVLDPVSLTLPGAAPSSARARGAGGPEGSPSAAGLLHLEASLGPLAAGKDPADWSYRVGLSGHTARTQDLLTVSDLLGRSIAAGWSAEGPATLQLVWTGTARRETLAPSGMLDLRGLRVTSPFLNQPVVVSSASVELLPGSRHVKLLAAEGLGAVWKGTLDWDALDPVWRFDLAADHLDAFDLDRWLGPRARPGFFARMLPLVGYGEAPARNADLDRLAAEGELHVAELELAPLDLQKVEAAMEIKGRKLALRRAQAELLDGRVMGELEAQLTANPSYSFRGQFDRVNLAALTSSETLPDGRLGGLASGEVQLSAHGVGREALLGSLSARGDFRVRTPVLRGLDLLSSSLAAGDSRIPGETRFRTADASFRMTGGLVHIDRLALAGRDTVLQLQGSVDLARHLDLHAWNTPRAAVVAAESDAASERIADRSSDRPAELNLVRQEWSIGGTLDAPLVARQSPLAGDVNSGSTLPASLPSRLSASPGPPLSTRR